MTVHYLTVQDILWINLQVTKKVQRFNYAKLEEASFFQYAYGSSNNLPAQASRFLSGFARLKPIAAGNEATAFIGAIAFLSMNGIRLAKTDEEAAGWVRDAMAGKGNAADEIRAHLVEDHGQHHSGAPDVRTAVSEVMALYPSTIEGLVAGDAAAAR
jgi:prophage maintenance system killer protein